MESVLHQRQALRRPEPRRVLSRHQLTHKPVAPVKEEPAVGETKAVPVNAKETKEHKEHKGYSKVTPVYVTPKVGKVSASRLHASGPIMDYVPPVNQRRALKPVKPVKRVSQVGKVAIEEPVSQRNFDLLLAAELAGETEFNFFETGTKHPATASPNFKKAGHRAQPASPKTTKSKESVAERTAEELTPLPSHRLNGDERKELHKQFQSAARSHARLAKRKEVRKKVASHVNRPRVVLSVLMTGVILSGAYTAVGSFNSDQQSNAALAQASSAQVDSSASVLGQVTDGASTAPSTIDSDNYTVAADLAKFIRIPRLDVNAPVVSVGLTTAGAVDTPRNIWEAAWYNGSAKPGALGQTFINGHASSTNGALFGNLEQLAKGDKIEVERGDGTVLSYRVVHTEHIDRHDVDMSKVLQSWNGSARGLTLLTCDGEWIPSEQTLANRVIVWAEQV